MEVSHEADKGGERVRMSQMLGGGTQSVKESMLRGKREMRRGEEMPF